MTIPATQPTIMQELRYVTDMSAIRKAFMTSFGPEDGMINLFCFNDPNDDNTANCANVPYSSTITDGNTWHYIADEG